MGGSSAEMQLPEDRKRNLFLELGGVQSGSEGDGRECRGLNGAVYDLDELTERKKEAIQMVLPYCKPHTSAR